MSHAPNPPDQPPDQLPTPSPMQLIGLPLLAAVGFAVLTWPVWRWLWSEWMANDYYSHGILIAPVAIFLAVQRFRNASLAPAPAATRAGAREGAGRPRRPGVRGRGERPIGVYG